jgi:hypothetical protein
MRVTPDVWVWVCVGGVCVSGPWCPPPFPFPFPPCAPCLCAPPAVLPSPAAAMDAIKRRMDPAVSSKFPMLCLYPEGTTTTGRCLITFKKGAFGACGGGGGCGVALRALP